MKPIGSEPARELRARWQALDADIRSWWDGDMRTAQEADVCNSGVDWTWTETIATIGGQTPVADPAQRTLLFLPFPFSPAGGDQGAFPEMFAWDSYFINLGLLAHGRFDLVRGMLLNQLFMIMRHGMVLNANRTYFLSRSQPPLHPDAIWRYFQATGDRELLLMAYPLLSQEYRNHWCNADHSTPTGLATNNDTKDPYLRSELASEAESGLDFSALFEGDIRRCVPLATNAQLVRYEEVLGLIAGELGFADEMVTWRERARSRAERLRELCWNEQDGFFFEYDYVRERQIPVWSLCAYWLMWAGVADEEQTRRLVDQLPRFEHERGLTFTDKIYPSPFREFEMLQWSYPYCWPPLMTMTTSALANAGYDAAAWRIGAKYLGWVVTRYGETGKLWEKYVAVPELAEESVERYGTASMHGWAAGSVAVVGRAIGLDH